jgi:hypothetical protein
VPVTRTSTMQSVPSFQKQRRRISPRSSSLAAFSFVLLLFDAALAPFASRHDGLGVRRGLQKELGLSQPSVLAHLISH